MTYRDQISVEMRECIRLGIMTDADKWAIGEMLAHDYSEDCSELAHMKVCDAVDMLRDLTK